MGEFGATITFVSNIPGETQTIPIGDLQPAAGAGRRERRDPADADLDRHRHGRAARLGVRGAAGRPPHRRPLSGMSLEVGAPPRPRRLPPRRRLRRRPPASPRSSDRSGSGKTTVVNAIAGLLRPEIGPHRRRWGGPPRHHGRRLRAAPPPAHRLRLPGGTAVPASLGAAEPGLRPLVRRRSRAAGRDRPRRRDARHRPPARPPARPASPAARSSGWRSAGRCSRARGSS